MKLTIPKPVKIWAGRVAAAALAAVVDALQHGKLPHTTADALALVSGAVVAATPVLKASGLLRPVAPGQPSLAQRALAALVALAKAPADKRKQAALDAVNQAKADAEAAGRAAAQAEMSRLIDELKTGKYQSTEAGLVPVADDVASSDIPNVAGTGAEVTIPQTDDPAVVEAKEPAAA